jgi:hypothetical protein
VTLRVDTLGEWLSVPMEAEHRIPNKLISSGLVREVHRGVRTCVATLTEKTQRLKHEITRSVAACISTSSLHMTLSFFLIRLRTFISPAGESVARLVCCTVGSRW